MSSTQKTFYITTTLPYVNADPHIGFAMEVIRADIIARFKKLEGFEVFFNTGTDEHGLKIYRKAIEAGKDPKAYVDEYALKFQNLKGALGLLDELNFIRTTDPHHTAAAEEFWCRAKKQGFIYKKNYTVKYCVGCELEKTNSELNEQGHCPLHPDLELEAISEENYFFKFSAFQKLLLDFYAKTPDFVVPDFRYNEIKAFVAHGLEDFSISRLKSKLPWGVTVPDDPEHTMYVWFDALVSYISAVGWPDRDADFEKWWIQSGGAVQYCGKDNLRQQSAMWQAMLMAAGLAPSKQIVINGFITSGGQKMSKSLGNVIDPVVVVKEYGADALRYFVARELSPFEDGDFTTGRFREAYNANLANGLGNLASRILKMAEQNRVTYNAKLARLPARQVTSVQEKKKQYQEAIEKYDLKSALDFVWEKIRVADGRIQRTEPFKLIRAEPAKAKTIIVELLGELDEIGELLRPFFPETSAKIIEGVQAARPPAVPLFPRK